MGGNMARRLLAGGHDVVVWDRRADAVTALASTGAAGAQSMDDLVARVSPPRTVWLMVPAGDITKRTVSDVAAELDPGDVIIDGGNSCLASTPTA
jgi:6-phosphogluconate dehydrogenase